MPRCGSAATETSLDEVSVIGFKDVQAGVEQVALRDDDDVKAGGDFVATEDLSNQSFRSVSLNGSPELAGSGDSQPPGAAAVRQEKHCAVAAMNPRAALVYLLEFRPAANTLVWAETQLLAADSKALPALCAPALQHQPPVFRAHAHQKPVRLLAMARVGLKSAESLGHDIPSEWKRTLNVSGTLRKVSINSECVTVGVLLAPTRPQQFHAPLVSRQSFPHLWKKLWKNARIDGQPSDYGRKLHIGAILRLR
jgi:hypothetical protein